MLHYLPPIAVLGWCALSATLCHIFRYRGEEQ